MPIRHLLFLARNSVKVSKKCWYLPCRATLFYLATCWAARCAVCWLASLSLAFLYYLRICRFIILGLSLPWALFPPCCFHWVDFSMVYLPKNLMIFLLCRLL